MEALLKARGLKAAEFARRVGITRQQLYALLRRPPTTLPAGLDLAAWAQVLAGNASERRLLEKMADVSWSPASVQQLLRELGELPRDPV